MLYLAIFLDCKSFTIDKCQMDVGSLFETVNDVSEETCQEFCNVIYDEDCKFFIFDRQQHVCLLMSQTRESFVQSCKKTGGPKVPKIEDCKTNTDPCMVRSYYLCISNSGANVRLIRRFF